MRVGYLVALAVADLRLRWRGGDAAGQLADWLSQGVPGGRGGRHSALYETYLQTDAWRARRERTLLLAGYTCQRCGRAKATDAHHLTYDRLGRERDGDLLALCEPCHGALHGRPAGAAADAGDTGAGEGDTRPMDTLTLRALWLTAVDAPLAPALELLTGAGLALLGLSARPGRRRRGRGSSWRRGARPGRDRGARAPPSSPGAPAGWGWRRLGLALGGRAIALAAVPGPDGAAVLWCALGAVVPAPGAGRLDALGGRPARWPRFPGPPSPTTCAGSPRRSRGGTGRRPAG